MLLTGWLYWVVPSSLRKKCPPTSRCSRHWCLRVDLHLCANISNVWTIIIIVCYCYIICVDTSVGSWSLLDIRNDLLLASCSSINQPEYLVRSLFYFFELINNFLIFIVVVHVFRQMHFLFIFSFIFSFRLVLIGKKWSFKMYADCFDSF